MMKNNSYDIDQFIIQSTDDNKILDLSIAGVKNADTIIPKLIDNPRYNYSRNQKDPPKIDSHLVLFDCITCNKCLPVCPNAANFSITTGKEDFSFLNYKISEGKLIPTSEEKFVLEYDTQIANLADFCNDCGDCDTYCPEYGGPFIQKPRFFSSKESYEKYKNNNGYYFLNSSTLQGCIAGKEYELAYEKDSDTFLWADKFLKIRVDRHDNPISINIIGELKNETTINMKDYYIMKTLFNGIRKNKDSYPARILLRS
jgi:ferredoxin